MPTPATAKWPKPRSEDEFEDLAVDFVRLRWKDPNAQRHGRRGQRQHGVDITGHPPWLGGRTVAAQCKNTDMLSLADIIAEVAKARAFPGGLAEFYLLTTGERDAALQNQVRAHFRASPAPFEVEVVFWPDITADVAADDALVAKHWKGFGPMAAASAQSTSQKCIGREGAKPNETTECNCEFVIRSLDCDGLDATELRAELQRSIPKAPADHIGRMLLEKQPSIVAKRFVWSTSERPYDNVFDKWELEIGAAGYYARRWAKFSTQTTILLDTYDLLSNVIVPLTKYSEALASWSSGMTGARTTTRVAMTLSLHATKPPQLNDRIRLVEASERFATQESPLDWTVELETDLSSGPVRVAQRLLNRGLAQFVEKPTHWDRDNHHARLVRIDDAAYAACLARAGL